MPSPRSAAPRPAASGLANRPVPADAAGTRPGGSSVHPTPLRPAPFAALFAVLGIALLVAERSDYSVAGAVILGIAALPIAVHRIRAPFAVLGFLLVALLSIFWSVMPAETAAAVVRLFIIAIGAAIAAAAFGRQEFARLFMFGSGLTVGLSIAMGLAGIGSARGEGGLLQGVTSHPNVLAFACALCTLSAVASWRPREDVLFPSIFLVVGVMGLAMAQSATAGLALGVAIAFMLLLRFLRPSPALEQHASLVTAITVLLIVLALSWRFYDAITEALGRDPTLTGRTGIWQAVLAHISERPLGGWGLGATWTDDSPVTAEIAREIGFRVFHSHNGYLDVTLQLGVVGLILMLAIMITLLVRGTRATLAGTETTWVAGLMMLLMVYSLSETVVLRYGGWALLCYLAFSTGRIGARIAPRKRLTPRS